MNRAGMNEDMMEQVNGGAWYDVIYNGLDITYSSIAIPFTAIYESGKGVFTGNFDYTETKKPGKNISDVASNMTAPNKLVQDY